MIGINFSIMNIKNILLVALLAMLPCICNAEVIGAWIKADAIADGDQVIFVCETYKREFQGISSSFGASKSYSDAPVGACPLTVEKDGDAIYFRSNSGNYLEWGGDSSKLMWVANSKKKPWNVSFVDGIAEVKSTSDNRYLLYVSGSSTFRLYTTKNYETSIAIYVLRTGKAKRNLAFPQDEYTVDFAETFAAPELSGVKDGVTYSSSNEAVATVDATTGAVTLIGAGNTTITATAAETEIHYAGTASYNLVVTDNANVNTVTLNFSSWYQVSSWGITQPPKSNNSAISTLFFEEVKLTPVHGNNTETSIYRDKDDNYSLRIYKGGNITFCVPDSYEITEVAINGTNLNNGSISLSSLATNTTSLIAWTGKVQSFTYASVEGTCIIKTITIKYAPCSARPQTKQVTIGNAGYATFASAHAWVLPAGVTAATAKVVGEQVVLTETYASGSVLPANTGVLLCGEADVYEFLQPAEGEVGSAPTENALCPALTNQTIEAPAGCQLFILANDATNGIGFYYQGSTGDGSTVAKIGEKAYLVAPVAYGVKGYQLQWGDATAIHAVEQAHMVHGIYTLQGTAVQTNDVKQLPKGIYIVNGKKQVIR